MGPRASIQLSIPIPGLHHKQCGAGLAAYDFGLHIVPVLQRVDIKGLIQPFRQLFFSINFGWWQARCHRAGIGAVEPKCGAGSLGKARFSVAKVGLFDMLM